MDSTTNTTSTKQEEPKRIPLAPQNNAVCDESKILTTLSRGFPGETFVYNKRVSGTLRYTLDVYMPEYDLAIDITNIGDVKNDQRDNELIKLFPDINIFRVNASVSPEILIGSIYRIIRTSWKFKAKIEKEEFEKEIARLNARLRIGEIQKDINELEAFKAKIPQVTSFAFAETS